MTKKNMLIDAAHTEEVSRGEPVYGRLISTSSEAFLFASVGQPNYAAAKAGIVALTLSAAQAMLKYGVTANAVLPRARTRMTMEGPTAAMFAKPEEGFDAYAPEHTAPLVAYLASPQAERISGQVFVVYGKQVSVVGAPTVSARFETAESWNIENLEKALGPHFAELEPIRDGFIFSG